VSLFGKFIFCFFPFKCRQVFICVNVFVLRHRDVLRIIFCFSIKVLFYLVNAHFFPFLSRKKKKEVGERKKKKDRGRFSAARRNTLA